MNPGVWMLVLLGAATLGLPAQSVTFAAYPVNPALGQTVLFTVTNQTSSTISILGSSMSVYDAQNRKVASWASIPMPVPVGPGKIAAFSWGQKDDNSQQVPAGLYEGRITVNWQGSKILKAPVSIQDATLTVTGIPQPGASLRLGLQDSTAPGLAYRVVLSLGNTSGIALPGKRLLPLTADTLFFTSLQMGPPVQVGFVGTLSASGAGTAWLNVPAHPALKGLTLYTAFATSHPAAPGGIFSHSDAVSIQVM